MLRVESHSPVDPVVVHHVPEPWQVLGCGNYAAVFCHPDEPEVVVKVYAPDRPGIEAEAEVYQRLGDHPAFSCCYRRGDRFLVLRRLHGVTLYDCLHRGIAIPPQAIRDIDQALKYASQRGLFPHDVHGKNLMLHEGRGLVVDISDFLKREDCNAWRDLRRAYRYFYHPIIYPLVKRLPLRVPYRCLDWVRSSYRIVKRLR